MQKRRKTKKDESEPTDNSSNTIDVSSSPDSQIFAESPSSENSDILFDKEGIKLEEQSEFNKPLLSAKQRNDYKLSGHTKFVEASMEHLLNPMLGSPILMPCSIPQLLHLGSRIHYY